MLNPHRISVLALFATIAFLAIGELVSGTDAYYVVMMAVTMLCIGVTYNILGGVGTIGGMAFSSFALCTFVISQFAKVLLFEAADKNLEVPKLTIAIYMVFYVCALLGTFIFGRIRLKLPKPLEPVTEAQAGLMYAISLSVGLVANVILRVYSAAGGTQTEESAQTRSLGLAFSGLLLFAIVIAVERRIASTQGEHSVGMKVFIPVLAVMTFGFLYSSRTGLLLPIVVYAVTCYTRGYRFKTKHYIAALVGIVAFVFIISPFEIYARGVMADMTFRERTYEAFHMVGTVGDWATVEAATQNAAQSNEARSEYFSTPGTFVLSRLSAIRADSNLIDACSGGFHYGFTALKMDLMNIIPRFFYKNKPENDSAGYIGRVSGMNGDVANSYSMVTAISDSYGAFEWLGVVLVPLIVFPAAYILYESLFDITRPWGTVALGVLCSTCYQASMGQMVGIMLRIPVEIVLLSYLTGWIIRMIPSRGDRSVRLEPATGD